MKVPNRKCHLTKIMIAVEWAADSVVTMKALVGMAQNILRRKAQTVMEVAKMSLSRMHRAHGRCGYFCSKNTGSSFGTAHVCEPVLPLFIV